MTTAAHVIGALLRFLFAVIRFVALLANRERMAAFEDRQLRAVKD